MQAADETYMAFMGEWKKKRYSALDPNSQLADGTVLGSTPPSALPALYGLSNLSSDNSRPSMGVRRPRYQLEMPTNITMRLKRGLRTGPDRWSQVWLAELLNPANDSEVRQVVIKLFHEALFPLPDYEEVPMYKDWCADTTAAKEAWAFQQLVALQGSVLPHSYGFFDFNLPCGQIVCGHVMEAIDGEPLKRDYGGMLDGSWYSAKNHARRRDWLDCLAEEVYSIHLLGVHHGDLDPTNVLQLRDETGFVLIDFGRARPYDGIRRLDIPDWIGLIHCLEEMEDDSSLTGSTRSWRKEYPGRRSSTIPKRCRPCVTI